MPDRGIITEVALYFKISLLKNFATFTGKHFVGVSILKKSLQHRCFLVKI